MKTDESRPVDGRDFRGDCRIPSADIRFPREEEADRVVELIRATSGGPVVLYGRPSTGKSELMQNWVVPRLREEQTVFYSQCAGGFPDRALTGEGDEDFSNAVASPAILIVDDLDTLFENTGGSDGTASGTLADGFALLGRRQADEPMVLVLNERSLGKLFRFRSLLPGLTDAAHEVASPSRSSAFQTLRQEGREWGLTYDEDVVAALREDAESLDPEGHGVSAELITMIDSWMRRWAGENGDGEVKFDDLLEAGRLEGILRDCLERRLRLLEEELEVPGGARVGEAMLREVASTGPRESTSGWRDFNARQGISDDLRHRAETWLVERGRLLFSTRGGGRELRPRELRLLLQRDTEERSQTVEPLARILAQGVASWRQLNVLLPKERFQEIHRIRHDLPVSQEDAQLMARCALLYRPDEACYWLERIGHPERRVGVLLDATGDRRSQVRQAAARLLGPHPRDEVRDRLVELALREPDPEVRTAAVSSLSDMANDEVRQTLLAKARDGLSCYRAAAIEALQIFDEDVEVIALLKDLVDQPDSPLEIREAAVRTLSTFTHPDAVGALVDIALCDEDEEDRAAATRSLASIRSETQAGELLVRLRENRAETGTQPSQVGLGRWLRGTGACLSGLAAGAGNLLVHGLALACVGRWRVGVALFVAEAIALLAMWWEVASALPLVVLLGTLNAAVVLPIRPLLRRRSEQMSRPAPFWTTLGVATLVAATLPLLLIHGLGHLVGGRAKRGAFLFVLELLGLTSFIIAAVFFPTYFSILPFPETVSGVLRNVYRCVGVLVFFGSWLYDAVWLFVIWIQARTAGAKARRAAVYKEIVANPVVADRVLDDLNSSDPTIAASARAVVRRFGEKIPAAQLVENLRAAPSKPSRPVVATLRKRTTDDVFQAVRDVWSSAEAPLRRTLARILAGHPNESSLATLRQLVPELGWRAWLRYLFAVWQHRVMVWPKTLLLAGILVAPLAGLIGLEFWMSFQNPARPHIRFLRTQAVDSKKAVKTAEWLAEFYPRESGGALIQVYEGRPPSSRGKFASSLGLLAIHGPADHSKSAIHTLAEEVLDPGTATEPVSRQAALEALALIAKEAPRRQLIERLGNMLRPDGDPWMVAGSARILTAVARSDWRGAESAAEQLRDHVTSLAPLLEPPFPPDEQVLEVLDALEVIGTPQAVSTLRDFALRPLRSQTDAKRNVETAPVALTELRRAKQSQEDLHLHALAVLSKIGSPEAYEVMNRIAESAPSSVVRREASKQLEHRHRVVEVYLAVKNGKHERAIELGRSLLAGSEGASRAEVLLLLGEAGVALARRGNSPAPLRARQLEAAIVDLEEANALLGGDTQVAGLLSDAWVTAAEQAWSRGDLNTALTEADRAIAFNGSNVWAYATKATILAEREEWEEALATLQAGNQAVGGDRWFLAMQAWVHLQQNEPARAEASALQAIRSDPNDAWAYGLLFDSFVQREQYRRAVRTFEEIRAEAPDVAWPIQQLVYLNHEHLSLNDPGAFERTHQLLDELLADFPEVASQPDYVAERVENKLTTGRYAEAIALGKPLLTRSDASAVAIPATFFLYAAHLLEGDRRGAGKRLEELRTRVEEADGATEPTWSYRGTRTYIATSVRPAEFRRALLDLVDAISQGPPGLPDEVVEANRRALEDLN